MWHLMQIRSKCGRSNLQKSSQKAKQIFAAKPLLKMAKFSQFGRKKAKIPTLRWIISANLS